MCMMFPSVHTSVLDAANKLSAADACFEYNANVIS